MLLLTILRSRPPAANDLRIPAEEHLFLSTRQLDGRWGASLEINDGLYRITRLGAGPPEWPPRPVPLLVYDLWNDPYCLHSLHEERLDLVEKYTALLEEQWAAHQALAQLFSESEAVPLTPEQLEALRSLGYIQ